jgi:hypothetical protein
MTPADLLTRGTAIAALALYALALALRMSARRRHNRLAAARLLWTAGCAVFLAHVACAFQFVHHWSHSAAYDATARETFEVFGWNWGGGLYANDAFTFIWVLDTAWWWGGLDVYEARPRWLEWFVQAFLAFMAFNATVVFGHGPARWLGIAASAGLGFLLMRIRRRR